LLTKGPSSSSSKVAMKELWADEHKKKYLGNTKCTRKRGKRHKVAY
jgi:hypothetical protein